MAESTAEANPREPLPPSWSRPGTLLRGGDRDEAVEGATLWLEFRKCEPSVGPFQVAPSVSVSCGARRLEIVKMDGGDANIARSPRDPQVIIVRGPCAIRPRLLPDRAPGVPVLFRFRLDSSVDADECFHLLRHWLGAPFDRRRETTTMILDPMPAGFRMPSAQFLNLSLSDGKDDDDDKEEEKEEEDDGFSDSPFEVVKPEEARDTLPAWEGDEDRYTHHYDPMSGLMDNTEVRRYIREMTQALGGDGVVSEGVVSEPTANFATTPVDGKKLSFARYVELIDSVLGEMQANGELVFAEHPEDTDDDEDEDEIHEYY